MKKIFFIVCLSIFVNNLFSQEIISKRKENVSIEFSTYSKGVSLYVHNSNGKKTSVLDNVEYCKSS